MTSTAVAYGVYLFAPGSAENHAIVKDNEIVGGTAKSDIYGLFLQGNNYATIERNAVFACPFASDDPRCTATQRSIGLVAAGGRGAVYANNYFFGGRTACMIGCPKASLCISAIGDLRFDSNLCMIASGQAAMIVDSLNGLYPSPLLVNNIFHVETGGSPALTYSTPWNAEFEFRHNTFVTSGACKVTSPDHPDEVICAKTAAEIDGLDGNGIVLASGNYTVAPQYVLSSPTLPTVAGYHLDAACTLAGLAEVSPFVTSDYDGDPRGPQPELGPDECL